MRNTFVGWLSRQNWRWPPQQQPPRLADGPPQGTAWTRAFRTCCRILISSQKLQAFRCADRGSFLIFRDCGQTISGEDFAQELHRSGTVTARMMKLEDNLCPARRCGDEDSQTAFVSEINE